jgi:hypothetical protein
MLCQLGFLVIVLYLIIGVNTNEFPQQEIGHVHLSFNTYSIICILRASARIVCPPFEYRSSLSIPQSSAENTILITPPPNSLCRISGYKDFL